MKKSKQRMFSKNHLGNVNLKKHQDGEFLSKNLKNHLGNCISKKNRNEDFPSKNHLGNWNFQKNQNELFFSKEHLGNVHLKKFELKDLLNNDDFLQKVCFFNFLSKFDFLTTVSSQYISEVVLSPFKSHASYTVMDIT